MLMHMPEWWEIVCRFQKYKCCVCVMFLSWENGKKLKTLFPNLQKILPYSYQFQKIKNYPTPTTCKKMAIPLPLEKKTTLPLPLAKKTTLPLLLAKKTLPYPYHLQKKYYPTPTTCKIKLPHPYHLQKNYPTPTTCKIKLPYPYYYTTHTTCKKTTLPLSLAKKTTLPLPLPYPYHLQKTTIPLPLANKTTISLSLAKSLPYPYHLQKKSTLALPLAK